jgi:hypothetical protein
MAEGGDRPGRTVESTEFCGVCSTAHGRHQQRAEKADGLCTRRGKAGLSDSPWGEVTHA